MTRDTKKRASYAAHQIHGCNAEMMALLEDSGGEVTPEVIALETELAKQADELGRAGASLKLHARSGRDALAAERERLRELSAYYDRLEGYADRCIRIAAHEMGDVSSFSTGSHLVSLRKKPARLVGGPPVGSDGWARWPGGEALVPEMTALVDRGLADWGMKPDRKAILASLKSGDDVLDYAVEQPTEKSVVVK